MKLTNVSTMLKANAVKVLAATALAGALFTAAAPAAEAQRFAVGVRIGGPAYYGHAYYGPRYVAPVPPPVVYGYGYPGYYGYHRDWRYDHRFAHRGWR
jgi:hypothetical protein